LIGRNQKCDKQNEPSYKKSFIPYSELSRCVYCCVNARDIWVDQVYSEVIPGGQQRATGRVQGWQTGSWRPATGLRRS